jgi:hypothetical protein
MGPNVSGSNYIYLPQHRSLIHTFLGYNAYDLFRSHNHGFALFYLFVDFFFV